ncbi:MAG: class I tRNA ligase family protein, partial [Candidatus Levyibacteriota bacterium]
LGKQIDIHGGGLDLMFPHHESEIAQSESFTGKKPFSKYFMHAAMVHHEGEKMSKSLGNLVLVKNLLKKYSANEIRWTILSRHYRSSWMFNVSELDKAKEALAVISSLPYSGVKPDMNKLNKFLEHLSNDLDTKNALLEVMKMGKDEASSSEVRAALYILGFKLM